MSSSHFLPFPFLPAELRIQIWEAAFSAPTVLAAVRLPDDDVDGETCPTYTMTFVGPAPHLVAMSCSEAREVLTSAARPSSVDEISGPLGSTGTRRRYWVSLDHTVVHLRTTADATEVLAGFDVAILSKFKHVALTWDERDLGGLDGLVRICRHLAIICPALETLIIQFGWGSDDDNEPSSPSLSPEVAAFYAAIPASAECPCNGQEMADMAHLQRRLLQPFTGDSPPRLYLLPPGFCHPL
jgi:hypothetical protein